MKTMKPSLRRIEAVLEALDHPERSYPSIHIGGTNGKTSCARITAALLSATGLSVGTFTSPHLQDVRERLARNGVCLSEDEFGAVFEHAQPYVQLVERDLGERLSYFEVLTAMFFLWAAEAPVDVAVVEVGLGGRWDATNVLTSAVVVLTGVELDHTSMLGEDKVTIAREKVGIFKDRIPVVTGERDPTVLAVIEESAQERAAPLVKLPTDFEVVQNDTAVGGRYLSLKTSDGHFEDLFLPLHGRHQGVNAALALEAVGRFVPPGSLGRDVVAAGFGAVHVPGRLESIPLGGNSPRVVLDVAHNPDGMSALVTALLESFAFDHAVVVFGALSDKDERGMLLELSRLPCELICTQAGTSRARSPEQLARTAGELGIEASAVARVDIALEKAIGRAGQGGFVCVTGSHYVVGEARGLLTASSRA